MLNKYLPLLAILTATLVLHLLMPIDVRYNDNLYCAHNAYKIANGTYTLEYNPEKEPHGQVLNKRFLLILPIALFYKLLGVSYYSSIITPLLFSFGTIFLIYKICLETFSKNCAIIAAMLIAIYPLHFIYATQFYSDIAISFFFALSIYIFLKAESRLGGKYFFLSGFALGLGHLVKEISFFPFVFFTLYALVKKQFKKEYFLALLGFLIIPILELVFYFVATGYPLYRYNIIEKVHLTDVETMFFTGASDTLKRLFVAIPSMMFNPFDKNFPFLGPLSYIFLLSTIFAIVKRDKKIRIFLLWWLAISLCIFFWPIKIHPYIPAFVPWARTVEPMSVPMVIIIAYTLTIFTNSTAAKFVRWCICGGFIAVSLISNFFIATYMADWTREARSAFLWLKEMNPKIIYADAVLTNGGCPANLIQYWNKFENCLVLKTLTEENLSNAKEGYVFINWLYLRQSISESNYKPPLQIYSPPSNWEKVYEKDVAERRNLREIIFGNANSTPHSYEIEIFKINPLPHNK